MKIAVYCGSSTGKMDAFCQSAITLGRWIGKSGHTLVYGGANTGLMGAVADAVLAEGGKVIGVLPDVPLIQARKHPGLTEYMETESMAERKTKMIELADTYVALPGGLGTLDEISEILSLQSLGIVNAPIIFFNTSGYYNPMKEVLENIVESGFGDERYFQKVLFSADIEEIEKFLRARLNVNKKH